MDETLLGELYPDECLLDGDGDAGAMSREVGGIHAANFSNPGLIVTAMLNADAGLENVSARREAIDEKVGGGIARHFVVAKAILPTIAAEDIHWFGATTALVFEVDVFQRSVVT